MLNKEPGPPASQVGLQCGSSSSPRPPRGLSEDCCPQMSWASRTGDSLPTAGSQSHLPNPSVPGHQGLPSGPTLADSLSRGEGRCCDHTASTGSKRSGSGDFKFNPYSPAPAPSPLPGPLRPQPQGQAESLWPGGSARLAWPPAPPLTPAPGLRLVADQAAVGVPEH